MTAMIRLILRIALLGVVLFVIACAVIPAADISKPRVQSIVDVHVHVAGIGSGDSGCFISRDLRDGYKFKWYLKAFGVTLEELQGAGDGLVLRRLSEQISASRWLDKAVVLAMDGVITENGDLDEARTQVYVPNEFLIKMLAGYENLLFGASVNPYRHDALERLRAVKANGAVLVKWIPAIMDIDPADLRLEPFYRTLVELDLPLLVHVGQERSFGHAQDELGDPVKLALPLRLGVTVIAAHIATTGRNQGQRNYDRILPLFARYDNLYTDISSLTQINKLGYLYRALAVEGLHERMIYGSDWPLQFFPLVSPWYQLGHVPIGKIKAVGRIENQWDRDIALKSAMGVPDSVFERTSELLRLE
jgi:hypothetical protein